MQIARKYWYIIVVLLAVGGGLWWLRHPRGSEFQEFTVTRQPLSVTLSTSGVVSAERNASLVFQSGGRLVWVGVKKGDRVKKWQGIASLDQRTLQKNIEKELNDYLKTRWDFQTTRESNNVSTDNLDQYTLSPATRRVLEKSQFDLNNAVLDVEIQSVAKEFATIIAPFDGIVTDVPAQVGSNVSAATSIVTIVDPDSLYFEADVDEVDLEKLRLGAPVVLTLDAYPDEPINAHVGSIGFAPIALSGGGTGYQIRIDIPHQTPDLRYKPGMNGTATVTVAEVNDVLTLPVDAVVQKDGGPVVQIRNGRQVEEKRITIGLETPEFIEITQGLSEGETVVIRAKKR